MSVIRKINVTTVLARPIGIRQQTPTAWEAVVDNRTLTKTFSSPWEVFHYVAQTLAMERKAISDSLYPLEP